MAQRCEELNWKTYFIYLVRDGRSVINSMMKQNVKMNWKGNVETLPGSNLSFKDSFTNWFLTNLKPFIILELLGTNNYIKIKLEDLQQNPIKELKNISRFVEEKYSRKMLLLDSKTHHMVGGNASRLNAKRIRNISPKWSNISKSEMKKFNIFGGWFNKLIGY